MNIDSHFRIGADHFVCEDYALTGADHVIVCDGCSHGDNTNSHKTDFGARILARTASIHMEHLTAHCPDRFMHGVLAASDLIAMNLSLGLDSLAATLMVLKAQKDDIMAFAMGDGLIGGKKRDGSWSFSMIEFPSGAPFYLSYLSEKINVAEYLENYGDTVKETVFEIDPAGKVEVSELTHHIGQQGWRFLGSYPIDEYEAVFIASDGVGTFKGENRIMTRELIPMLFDFKNYSGPFVKRALNWHFKKNTEGALKHRGLMHDDDLAMGVIYCGKD